MTSMRCFIIKVAVGVAVVIGSAGTVTACGCGASMTNLTMAADDTYVSGTGTYSFSYLCQGDVYVTITAPDSTYVSDNNGVTDSPISYTLSMGYGTLGGTYNGSAAFYYDGSDSGYGAGWLSPKYAYYFIQIPSYVHYVNTSASAALSTSACTAIGLPGSGWQRNVTLQLQDQGHGSIVSPSYLVADALTVNSPNNLGFSSSQTLVGSVYTNSYGQWPDSYIACSTYCPTSGQSNVTQSWTANSKSLPYTNSIVYKCTGITIDGN